MKRLLLILLFALPCYIVQAQQDLAIDMLSPLDQDSVVSQMTFTFEVSNEGTTTFTPGTSMFVEFVGLAGSVTNNSPFSFVLSTGLAPGEKDTIDINVNWNATPPVTFEVCLWLLGQSGDYSLGSGAQYGQIANVLLNDPTPNNNEACAEFTIIDNSAPTSIVLSNDSVDENQSPGITVGILSAVDVDSFDTYSYDFVSGAGGQDNASFLISNDVLITTEVFDYETQNIYHCRIEATDVNYGFSIQRIMTIYVNDLNEVGILEMGVEMPELKVFPNPTNGASTIAIDGMVANALEIRGLDGRLLRTINGIAGQKEIQLDGLAQGQYLLQLMNDGVPVALGRLIVTH